MFLVLLLTPAVLVVAVLVMAFRYCRMDTNVKCVRLGLRFGRRTSVGLEVIRTVPQVQDNADPPSTCTRTVR